MEILASWPSLGLELNDLIFIVIALLAAVVLLDHVAMRWRPSSPPATPAKPSNVTPSERKAISDALYRDVVKEAYDRVDKMFADPEYTDGYLIEDMRLRLAVGSAEVGRDGIQWSSGQPTNTEPTQAYRGAVAVGQRGIPGEFQKLANDPTWSDNHSTILEGLHSGTIKLRLNDRVAEEDREQASEQLKAIEAHVVSLCSHQFRREWAEALNDGFALWECVGFPLQRLAYRRAFTVDAWILDENEQRWEGTSFKTSGQKGQTYELPAEKLLLYSHRRTGLNLPGKADLRTAAPHILIKQQLIRLDAQACTAHGLGWRIIESDVGAQDASDDTKIVEVLAAGKAEDNPTLKLAPGRKLVWISPNGVLPDFTERIKWHEQQIEKALGARASTLEKSTYANADLIDRVDRRTVRYNGALFASFVTEELVPVVGRDLFGAELVQPTPICEYSLSADSESLAILVQLIQAGVITPTAEDEEVLRDRYNLPTTARVEPAVSDEDGGLRVA